MELLISYALQFVGCPYRWGGDDPINGYDCSGLIQEILASAGVDPSGDQSAQGLYDYFRIYGTLDKGRGALAFYGKSVNEVSHVALCLDNYRVIEAGGGGSSTTSRETAASQNAYVRVRDLHHRPDLLAIFMPRYRFLG